MQQVHWIKDEKRFLAEAHWSEGKLRYSVNRAFMRNQLLSLVFFFPLRAHVGDSPFHSLLFHFRLKSFHISPLEQDFLQKALLINLVAWIFCLVRDIIGRKWTVCPLELRRTILRCPVPQRRETARRFWPHFNKKRIEKWGISVMLL